MVPRLMKTNPLTAGLDLGGFRHTAHVLDEAGDIVAVEALANSREVLARNRSRAPSHNPPPSLSPAVLGAFTPHSPGPRLLREDNRLACPPCLP